ncbi:MAG: PAS domain-containing protein [Planctomycetes bacterium]|nr:PAS domain-containing protein [Planctomycetota bacterium]
MDTPAETSLSQVPEAVDDGTETESQRRERRQRRNLLRQAFGTKLLTTFAIILTLVVIVVFTAAGVVVHQIADSALEAEVGRRLESVAQMTAVRLRRPLAIEQARAGDEEAKSHLANLLTQVKRESGVRAVVLFTPETREVLATSAGADLGAVQAQLETDEAYVRQAAQQLGRATTSPLYPFQETRGPSTDWRFFKSGYAPIVVGQNPPRVIAMIGVEVPAEFDKAVEEVNNSFTFLGACAGLTVLAAAVLLVRQRVHLPVYRLVKAMQGEEDGRPQVARVRYHDEIGVLTEHYNDMVDRLSETDAELRELYLRAQETAAYLKGYSEHLVAGVPSGVVAVDPRGVVTVWNDSAARILRCRAQLDTQAEATVGADHPLAKALARALSGSVTFQALIVLGDEEEEQRLVELTCAPFHDEAGELFGAVALVTDRTELERFRQVAARNERLAAIGNLGAGLAHEIKNPLGAISGFAELIERKAGKDVTRLAKRLRGEVDELNTFLNEFLSFAREDVIRREPTDINALVERSVELAMQGLGSLDPGEIDGFSDAGKIPLAEGQEITLELELADDLPQLALDRGLMRSVITNLVRNALQAMSAEGGNLSVRTQRLGEQVYVRVRDSGPGVPLELREKIFNPLFTTRAEGTGLGLAIANKAVTAHRGKLSLRDVPGGGAEFVIALPVVAAASKEGKTS